MEIVNKISEYTVPIVILVIITLAMKKRIPLYDNFLAGASNGMKISAKIFPIICAILTASAMLRESGLLDFIIKMISPITSFLHIPSEVIPLMMLRPISGGGSIGILSDIISTYGADSLIGRCASVIMGSSETTFYAIMVYFSAVRIKYTRMVLPAALICDFLGMTSAILICSFLFG